MFGEIKLLIKVDFRLIKYLFVFYFLLASSAYAQHADFKDIDFSVVDSIAVHHKVKGNIDPVKTALDLTAGIDKEIDKYRVIFRWIAENIDYDVKLYGKIVSHNRHSRPLSGKDKRWNGRLNRRYIKHTIKKRTSICEGYSWLLETMCRTAGLSCVRVSGHARDWRSVIGVKTRPNHAWNAVKIDNKWYLSDPTWASGYVDLEQHKYHRDFDETYFLVSPEDFIANHYPTKPQWMLLFHKPTLTEFFNAPIKTTAFIDNRIAGYAPAAGKMRIAVDSVVTFQFSINKQLKSFFIEKSSVRRKENITETLTDFPKRNKEGYYVSSFGFSEKGDYTVKIYINKRLTFIYNVLAK